MRSYDQMFTEALYNYGLEDRDGLAAATVGIATKDGIKEVTAVIDLDYGPKEVTDVPDDQYIKEAGASMFLAVRMRTEKGKMFRVYKTRFIDFTRWETHRFAPTVHGDFRKETTALFLRSPDKCSWKIEQYGQNLESVIDADLLSEDQAQMSLEYIVETEVVA